MLCVRVCAAFTPHHPSILCDLTWYHVPSCLCAIQAVWWAHFSYMSAVSVLCLNLFTAFVLACGGVEDKGVHFVYSLFNLIIFSVVGMYSFYCGYKGLATRNMRVSVRYAAIQVPLLVFIFLCMLLGIGNYNGWLNLRRAEDEGEMKGFWVAMTVIESLLWLAVLGFTSYAYWLLHNKRTYGGRTGGTSAASASQSSIGLSI